MNILITNIGNRNIKYQDKLYSELEQKEERPDTKLSFRKWTKYLLDNFETEKEHIGLNILDGVLNQDIIYDKIFIIVSNQENNSKFNAQDTLYEGEIIKRLISSNYQIEDVELKELTEDVTNENYLMTFYQQFYACLLREYKDACFIFCDAGGTGQQKAASKIMAEFILPDSKWKIVYPKKDGSVEEKTQIEYRNIINKEQAIALVRKSQYEAALNILGGNINEIHGNKTFNLLSFAHFRINRVLERTRKLYDEKNALPNRKNPLLKSAKVYTVRKYSEEINKQFCGNNQYLFLSETLLVAYHKYLINNFRESVLDFAVFYEEFIDRSLSKIEKAIESIIGKKKYKEENLINKWMEDSETNCPETRKHATDKRRETPFNYSTVPLAIHLIAEQDFFPDLQPLAKILLPHLDFSYSSYKEGEQNSLREVRNKLAHEGKYLDETILRKELPYYGNLLEQCLDAWGLAKEDIYEQLNEMIENSIRNF
jgi:hypothetical protein